MSSIPLFSASGDWLRFALLAAVPALFLAGAWTRSSTPADVAAAWSRARSAAAAAACLALVLCIWTSLAGASVWQGPALRASGGVPAAGFGARADGLSMSMLLLVTFIGWVIVTYSRTYLSGESNQSRFVRALMVTLASVSFVVITNNLVVLALAWVTTSLVLHRLLTFYVDRPQALLAAHKKFIASRLGDACLYSGIGLIAWGTGSTDIDMVHAHIAAAATLTPALQAAAILVALAALLKCAQLPFHGWLIQVMEAPTPVSALLHAGIVNLGGFLLILMAPLITASGPAQTLLVLAGCTTAVLAALVMMTRISVKVMLAWSTCAQMGFMMIQCGLGAYELVLLHLLAHSLYKAHAFLGAGSAVDKARIRKMTAPAPAARWPGILRGVLSGVLVILAATVAWRIASVAGPVSWAFGLIAALALVPLMSAPMSAFGAAAAARLAGAGAAIAVVYVGVHHAVGVWILPSAVRLALPQTRWDLIAVVVVAFTVLFVAQIRIRNRPEGWAATRLYPWFYAGLFLDELFTRAALRYWPIRRKEASVAGPLHSLPAKELS